MQHAADQFSANHDALRCGRQKRPPATNTAFGAGSVARWLGAMIRAYILCVMPTQACVAAQPATQPFPLMQAVPLPDSQISFQHDGRELGRYWHRSDLRRPFVYPLIGPSGRSLSRMGHPHDPESHSHHNSFWVSHASVNGVSFWADDAKGKIVHRRIEYFEDAVDRAAVSVLNHWIVEPDTKPLVIERRRMEFRPLPGGQWILILDLRLESPAEVVFGKTPFGLIGVRMAKTIGVNDGGGTLRNSQGDSGEKDLFWKPARWIDYSGQITESAIEGLTLMDHPGNPNHPAKFHVRADGWMGASLSIDAPLTILPGKPLSLRYGLLAHSGKPATDELDRAWRRFAEMPAASTRPAR